MAGKPLSAVVAFVRVADQASFTRAAAELGVSPSALSQTVRGLEHELGVRLLQRTTRRVGLTEYGARFLDQVRPGLQQIEHALEDLDFIRDRPAGLLRITLPQVVAEHFVVPRLAEFRRLYPQVQVELSINARLVDVVAEGFDAGVRLGESLARDMIAVPVTPPLRQVVVATPGYFAAHPAPRRPEELTKHQCIVYRRSSQRLMPFEFSQDGHDFDVAVDGDCLVNNGETGLAMALAGIGIAQLFEVLARPHIASGALVSVLDDWLPPFPGFHVYYPAREQMAPKLRVFVDFYKSTTPRPG